MGLKRESEDIVSALSGQDWRGKKPTEWTEEERAAYARGSAADKQAWLAETGIEPTITEDGGDESMTTWATHHWDLETGEVTNVLIRRYIGVPLGSV